MSLKFINRMNADKRECNSNDNRVNLKRAVT